MARRRKPKLVEMFLFSAVLILAAGTRIWYLTSFANGGRSDGPWRVQEGEQGGDGGSVGSGKVGGQSPDHSPFSADQPEKSLVQNLRDRQWFGTKAPLARDEELTAHLAPGYFWSLYWLGRLPLGSVPLDQRTRWAQCLLGIATAGLYAWLALLLFESRLVAALTGLLCAFHPFWILNTTELQDGTLATFLLALGLLLGTRANQTGGAFASLLFGIALGGLVLVRAALIPFALIALLGFLWRVRAINRGWLCTLLTLLGFVNALAPWTFRNYKTFGQAVPVASSAWLHLWIGNNQQSTGGPQSDETILAALAGSRGSSQSTDKRELAAELAAQPQPQRYNGLARDVANEIKRNPAAALNHRLLSAVAFVFGENWLTDHQLAEQIGVEGTVASGKGAAQDVNHSPLAAHDSRSFVPIALYASMLIMISLGILGWRWSYAWRRSSILPAAAFMFVPLPYVLGHAEVLSGPRLPLDGVLLCFSAFAITCLIPGLAPGGFAGPDREIVTEW